MSEHLSPLAELKSAVREVRVLGAIGVCKLHRGLDRDAMAQVQRQLVDEGVWLCPFGKLLYTMPPFNWELNNERFRAVWFFGRGAKPPTEQGSEYAE